MGSYVIGIDLGTGSAKAIAMRHTGEVIDTAQVSYPTSQPEPGHHEQEPELIWQAFIKCISDITARQKQSPHAVSLSSAMHSVIPIDGKGKPLMNMMIWADNRSAAIATRIHQSAVAQLLYEQTGTPIHAMSPLCKIQWLKEHDAARFEKTARYISMKEYVWYQLFHQYEVDYSIASATGLLNVENLIWNDLSLEVTSLKSQQLSTPVNANHKRKCTDANLCRQLGVTKDTLFFIGASDGCLANVGSFATKEGSIALTIGSSGAVRVAKDRPMLNFKAMTFNYRLDDKTYICGGPTNNGGVVLNWYAENFLNRKLEKADDYTSLLEALAKSKPGANGLIFLPYVLGERAPVWSSNACGVFFGMRGYHHQSDFTRAVIEGICVALYDITQNMIDTGLDIREINVSGGFVKSEQWLQVLANIFGKKLSLINTDDASATGAAFLAMKDLGMIDDYQSLKPAEIREFRPESQHIATYQGLFLKYRNLYNSLSALMAG